LGGPPDIISAKSTEDFEKSVIGHSPAQSLGLADTGLANIKATARMGNIVRIITSAFLDAIWGHDGTKKARKNMCFARLT
jgi:DNA replicative helicase MCM subunit Mcm2 (Cdc46/Mcm family)